jgi:site-specific DNA-methyltransferase (adenine-specific)
MGLGRRGSKAHDPAKFYQTISWVEFMWILVELWRVLKPNCHAYVMCDSFGIRYFYDIMGKQQELWSNVKPLVWDKEDAGLGYHYRARYEFVMMLDKGRNRRLNNLGVADIFRVKRVQGDEKCCPTQKPLRLFELLVSQSSAEGEVVFDPFMGSGTTARACLTLGRKWLGFEIDTDMAQVARDSLINMGREMFRVEQGFAGDSPCPNENLPTPLQQAGLLR